MRDALGSVREGLRRLATNDIRLVAGLALLVGVLFHACVALAVLGSPGGDSQDDGGAGVSVEPAGSPRPETPAAPTRPPDRTDCQEIRSTDYRSETERQWFLRNCSGTRAEPPGSPALLLQVEMVGPSPSSLPAGRQGEA